MHPEVQIIILRNFIIMLLSWYPTSFLFGLLEGYEIAEKRYTKREFKNLISKIEQEISRKGGEKK